MYNLTITDGAGRKILQITPRKDGGIDLETIGYEGSYTVIAKARLLKKNVEEIRRALGY